jgi:hypothetical protein
MRIMPYRTLENVIEGVVITFVDITVSKTLEAELRKTQAGLYRQIDQQGLEQGLELEQRRPREANAEKGLTSPEPKAAS